MVESFYDIPKVLDSTNVPFILERLKVEKFEFVKSLTNDSKNLFRSILEEFFKGKLQMDEAIDRVGTKITPPAGYKLVKDWDERLFRSEASKLFTLGYGDYLLSIGETECYIPHTGFDVSNDCATLIADRKFPIKMIQDNVYANYGKTVTYPTVPLHANCRHIITKVKPT